MSLVFSRNSKVEIAPMKDETVLFNPANNKFCVLNETASFVWQMLESPRTTSEIAAAVASRYADVNLERAEQEIHQALSDLRSIDCVDCRHNP